MAEWSKREQRSKLWKRGSTKLHGLGLNCAPAKTHSGQPAGGDSWAGVQLLLAPFPTVGSGREQDGERRRGGSVSGDAVHWGWWSWSGRCVRNLAGLEVALKFFGDASAAESPGVPPVVAAVPKVIPHQEEAGQEGQAEPPHRPMDSFQDG
jgi:hypothetical protein